MKKFLESSLSRRSVLVGSGAAGAATIGAAILFAPRRGAPSLGRMDEKDITPLGDGFYLAGGWVLTEADLRAEELSPPDATVKDTRMAAGRAE